MCSPIKISQITGQPIPNSHRESHNVAGTFPYVSFESDDSEVDEEITGEPDASETHCQLILSKIKLLIEPQVKECAQLKEQLRKSNRKCEDLHRKCAEQAEEIKSLKETIASLKVELKDFVKQRVSLLADKDREIEKHEEEEVRLTKKLRASDVEINRHINEMGRLKREHSKQIEQLDGKVAFAASQLEAEKTKHKYV
jgi:sugar diacid utilization regulator